MSHLFTGVSRGNPNGCYRGALTTSIALLLSYVTLSRARPFIGRSTCFLIVVFFIMTPLLHVILTLYIYLYEFPLRFKMWFYWMMKIWNLRNKLTMRCLTDYKLLSIVVFIMYTVNLPLCLCFNSTNCVFWNEPKIYYPSRWICAFFSKDHEFMVDAHFTFHWLSLLKSWSCPSIFK